MQGAEPLSAAGAHVDAEIVPERGRGPDHRLLDGPTPKGKKDRIFAPSQSINGPVVGAGSTETGRRSIEHRGERTEFLQKQGGCHG